MEERSRPEWTLLGRVHFFDTPGLCHRRSDVTPQVSKKEMEAESNQPIQVLSEQFHSHAQRLTATLVPGTRSIEQIQQLMLAVLWYKLQLQWAESWYHLERAIQEAQLQGKICKP